MSERSTFQTFILVGFGALIVVGVLMFALFSGGGGSEGDFSNTTVTVWGRVSKTAFQRVADEAMRGNDSLPLIQYEEKEGLNFDREVVEAIASGRGPDMVIIRDDEIIRFEDKLLKIPYESYPERTFKDTFIEGGEIFLTPEGAAAFPLTVDPMVMYWNRDIFQSEGLAEPPRHWDEFLALTENLTEKDEALNITRSAVALGEYQNVNHAKEILTTLILQAGNPIVTRTDQGLLAVINESMGLPVRPADSALKFYTEFSNPSKTVYSWNRALPESQDAFVRGDLAIYFGPSSEIREIREKNPNLNFDVAQMPQIRDFNTKLTSGHMEGLSVLRAADNTAAAFSVLGAMTTKESVQRLGSFTLLPPVRRDLLSERPSDAFMDVFYNSALIAKSFLDPNKEGTDAVFGNMVERVLTGRSKISGSVDRAQRDLSDLIVENR